MPGTLQVSSAVGIGCQPRSMTRVLATRPCSSSLRVQRTSKPRKTQLTRVAEITTKEVATAPADARGPSTRADMGKMSYSQQYDEIFSKPLDVRKAVPKPSPDAQAKEDGAWKIFASTVYAKKKRDDSHDKNVVDLYYTAFIGGMHVIALAAPFTFSWGMVGLFFGLYFVTGCLGITLSYHRQLSHRSFTTPKLLEYILAYCGVLAVQGDPLEWVSSHRYHHLHTDTPLDPHSPYEGFWWSHVGWILNNTATMERVYDRNNAGEMKKDPFYRHLQRWYPYHVALQFAVLFALGGFPAVVWGGALRICWVHHITWFVNSASHCWGYQDYNTGDQSRNNWWVGVLAFGEGWHNNHHAFEFSARHGLKDSQVDMTWYLICLLEKLGLASNIKLPTQKQLDRLAF